jgi:hypothetical protein
MYILVSVSVSARTFLFLCLVSVFVSAEWSIFLFLSFLFLLRIKILSVSNIAERYQCAAMVLELPFYLSLFVLYTFTATAQELVEYGSGWARVWGA